MVERRAIDGGLRGQVRRRIATSPIGSPPGPPQVTMLVVGGLGMLVGVLVWWLFWFGDAVPPTGMRKWGSALFAGLFFLGGLYFAILELRNLRCWAERRMRGGREPWGEGYRWSRTMPPLPGPGTGWAGGCVGAAALAAFGVAINLIWLDPSAIRGSRLLAYSLTVLFTLVVAAMLVGALKYALRSLGRGGARLHLRDYPAEPGGRVGAEFELPKRSVGAGQCKATLACIEETRRAPGNGVGPRRLVVEIVAAQEKRIELVAASAGAQRPAVEFPLPPDARPTALKGEDGVRRYWVLEVGLSEGVGWTFLIPVYAT
jgi:hypothetical protein